MKTLNKYEPATEYTDDAYEVKGYRGVAWNVLGWETELDADTEWSGIEPRTGLLVCSMVGDDRHFAFDPEEVTALEDGIYCPDCGQIGCYRNQARLAGVTTKWML